MNKIPVIAIFDIGKTNKKLFLFDEAYKLIYEKSTNIEELIDEDGDTCEDLQALSGWVKDSFREIIFNQKFEIKALNFSTYGASFVYLDDHGTPLTPLYNYLKKYPQKLSEDIYSKYGGKNEFALSTASPALGSLNSGFQLYRIKQEQNKVFQKIKHALHLPQYLSFLFSSIAYTDLTSIGCHTALWNFKENDYHPWVANEGLKDKFAPLTASDKFSPSVLYQSVKTGVGLHDSSAALIPYLKNFDEPFILLSTGTWNIALNPFNETPLTANELANDCLCYFTFQGKPVKASRLFAGFEHEQQVKRISQHFGTPVADFNLIRFEPTMADHLQSKNLKTISSNHNTNTSLKESGFARRNLSLYNSPIECYHQLMLDIVKQQCASVHLVLKETSVNRVYVDGGFSKNKVFMNLLATSFPALKVYAATMAQATALGAALAIHDSWNGKEIPLDLIELQPYSAITTRPVQFNTKDGN